MSSYASIVVHTIKTLTNTSYVGGAWSDPFAATFWNIGGIAKSGAIFGAKLSSNDARAAVAEDLGIGSLSSGVEALCWRNTDARYCCDSHMKHIRWSLSKPFKNNHHCHQDGLVRISSIKSACKIVDHSREFGGRVVCHSEKCPGSLGICNRSV